MSAPTSTGRQVIANLTGVNASGALVTPAGSGASASMANHLSGWWDIRASGAKCNGVDNDADALKNAQIRAATDGIGITIPGKARIAGTVGTISVPIRFEGGGSLDLQAGGSVTLSGPLDAPLGRIFWANGGTLTFSAKVAAVYPQWWGAVGDGVTDDGPAIQAAIDAAPVGSVVIIPAGVGGARTIFSNVTISKAVTVRGLNKWATWVKPAAAGAPMFIVTAQGVQIENLHFAATGLTTAWAIEDRASLLTIENCYFEFFAYGLWIPSGFAVGEQHVSSSRFAGCDYGIKSDGGSINMVVDGLSTFSSCGSAIYLRDTVGSPTEGVSIHNVLIYSSGDEATSRAAIDVESVDFVRISDSMVDLNEYHALMVALSRYLSVEASYFSSIQATNASAIALIGNCSDAHFSNVQARGSGTAGGYALSVSALAGPSYSSDVVVADSLLDGKAGAAGSSGDVLLDSVVNFTLSNTKMNSGVAQGVAVIRSQGTHTASAVMSGCKVEGASSIYQGTNSVWRFVGENTVNGSRRVEATRDSGDRGDTSQTIAVGADAPVQRWATALTANRTVTLSTTGAANGDTFRVVRTGLGAFTLDVGGLKTIAAGTAAFVDVTYDGSAWVLTGYGLL